MNSVTSPQTHPLNPDRQLKDFTYYNEKLIIEFKAQKNKESCYLKNFIDCAPSAAYL